MDGGVPEGLSGREGDGGEGEDQAAVGGGEEGGEGRGWKSGRRRAGGVEERAVGLGIEGGVEGLRKGREGSKEGEDALRN